MGNPIPSRDARPLRWYKPTDHPQDNEDALWMAHGIGGRYSIQSDLDKFIVWHAADEFRFTRCDTIEACKKWAEADWQTAIRALSDQPDSSNEGLAELLPRYRHVKRGTVYEVIGEAELQMNSDLLCDGSAMIVYRGEDGKLWVREESEFHDGRFTALSTGRQA